MGKINTHANSDGTSHSNVVQNDFVGTTAPTKDDDSTQGFSVGSLKYYPAARKLFVCFDNTEGNAIWRIVYSNGYVKNTSGSEIARGQVVYIDGATGINATVDLAKADVEGTSALTLGLMLEDTANNAFGFVVTEGTIIGTGAEPVDTSGIAAGNVAFLSAATAGAFTGTPPSSPNHATVIGKVLVSHASQGAILVDVQNGFETTELHDVDGTTPTITGQVHVWNESNKKFELSIHTTCYAPTGIEFGNADQEYDVDGTTWVEAAAGGALGGIPDEGSAGHTLVDCLAAIATARDLSYLNIREDTGAASATNPLTLRFLFTNVVAFNRVQLRMKYTGSAGHKLGIEAWNYTTSAWERVQELTDETFYVDDSMELHGSSNLVGTGGDDGDVMIQIIHDNAGNAAHTLEVDYVTLCEVW